MPLNRAENDTLTTGIGTFYPGVRQDFLSSTCRLGEALLCRLFSGFSSFFCLQLQALVFLAERCQGLSLESALNPIDLWAHECDQLHVLSHHKQPAIRTRLIAAPLQVMEQVFHFLQVVFRDDRAY